MQYALELDPVPDYASCPIVCNFGSNIYILHFLLHFSFDAVRIIDDPLEYTYKRWEVWNHSNK